MRTQSIVALGVLFLAVATTLAAQERNRGGRPTSAQGGQNVRAPEGTRERPVSLPRPNESQPDPPVRTAPPQRPVPSPAIPGADIDGDGAIRDAVRPAPSGFAVVFSGGREGYGVVLGDCREMPDYAGFDFSGERCVPCDDPEADIIFEGSGGVSHMAVGEDSEIQDLGSTTSLGQIAGLRMAEWSRSHDVILDERRSYAVRTWEGSCAMFRVVSLLPGRVVFDWVVGRPTASVLTGAHEGVHRTIPVKRVEMSR